MPCIVRKIVVIYIYMDILMTYLNQSQEDKDGTANYRLCCFFASAGQAVQELEALNTEVEQLEADEKKLESSLKGNSVLLQKPSVRR